jgi:hypothetical protein
VKALGARVCLEMSSSWPGASSFLDILLSRSLIFSVRRGAVIHLPGWGDEERRLWEISRTREGPRRLGINPQRSTLHLLVPRTVPQSPRPGPQVWEAARPGPSPPPSPCKVRHSRRRPHHDPRGGSFLATSLSSEATLSACEEALPLPPSPSARAKSGAPRSATPMRAPRSFIWGDARCARRKKAVKAPIRCGL